MSFRNLIPIHGTPIVTLSKRMKSYSWLRQSEADGFIGSEKERNLSCHSVRKSLPIIKICGSPALHCIQEKQCLDRRYLVRNWSS